LPRPSDNPLDRPDWQLPAGVPRALWEYVHDEQIATEDEQFLAGERLLDVDRQILLDLIAAMRQRLTESTETVPPICVDLGCGTGRLARVLTDAGWDVVGVDLSQPSLGVAKSEESKPRVLGNSPQAGQTGMTGKAGSLALLRGNLCNLEMLPPAQFDLALLMFGTLGMVAGAAERATVLREAARLLKPGGTLLLHVHNWWRHLDHPTGRRWLCWDLGRRLRGRHDAGDTVHDYRGIPGVYHHVFTRGELLKLFAATGFKRQGEWALSLSGEPLKSGSAWWNALRSTGWIVQAERV
jgi:SAM-dependent methyltransferase